MFSFGESKSNSFLGGQSSSSESSSMIPTFQDESACAQICPNLTYQQRIIGFISCMAFGYIISLIGTLTLFSGFTTTNLRLFAIFYVVGNVISLLATGFLLGPKAQCKKMWDSSRRFTTAFYIIMIIIVFAVAITKQNIFLILFLLFVQILAGIWYNLSYIPFGRKIVSNFFRSTGACYPCYYVYDAAAEFKKKQSSSSSSSGGFLGFGGKK